MSRSCGFTGFFQDSVLGMAFLSCLAGTPCYTIPKHSQRNYPFFAFLIRLEAVHCGNSTLFRFHLFFIVSFLEIFFVNSISIPSNPAFF